MLIKIKAGALQLTVFITTIIAILLSGFILYIYLQNRFKTDNQFIRNTINTATHGINYSLKNTILLNDTTKVVLNSNTVQLHKSYWGVFEKVIATAKTKNKVFKKVALLGGHSPKAKTALYLKDNFRALVVAGNTTIKGSVFLPEQGVKPGVIGGKHYTKSQLIFGTIKTATNSLPKLPSALTQSLKQTPISNFKTENLKDGDSISNSFLKPVKTLFNPSEIRLNNITLTGHIIIKSEQQITVTAAATLKDVILIAPKIQIQSNTTGNFQAIASKTITVANNVNLNYPSALIVNGKNTNKDNKITIDKNTVVKGIVMYLGQPNPNNYNPQLLIKDKATVIGETYCTQNTELLGAINGSVYTDNFITKQYGTIYQNHIFNGTISSDKCPAPYSGLLLNTTANKAIVKWLY